MMTVSVLLANEMTLQDGEEHGVVSGSLDTATCCQWVGSRMHHRERFN